jgi:hypothetical protein
MKATLKNNFHNSEATVLVKNGEVSEAVIIRAGKKLCGIKGCTCGGVRGPQDHTISNLYNGWYSVEPH